MSYLVYKNKEEVSWVTPVPTFDAESIGQYVVVETLPTIGDDDMLDIVAKSGEDEGYELKVVKKSAEQIKSEEDTAKQAEAKAVQLSHYQQFKALWQLGVNKGNYARYRADIIKVLTDYELTGVFAIEHKGLQAFAKKNGIDTKP